MDFDLAITYEALTETALRDVFADVPLEDQVKLFTDFFVPKIYQFAGDKTVNYKLWLAYKAQADFTALGNAALAERTLAGKLKKVLDKWDIKW